MEWKLKPLVQVIKAFSATSVGTVMLLNGAQASVDDFAVTLGAGNIAIPDNNTNIVTQTSKVMIATVSRLDLTSNELLQHNAQLSGSSVLYKIQDVKASDIQGRIEGNANLKLMVLQNRNGMVFGPDSTVNVNSFVATTLDIDDTAFQTGQLLMDANGSTGVIVNQGLIQAATGGSVVLVAGQVENQGVILAEKGRVELASGSAVTIDFDGDGLLQLRVDEATSSGTGDAVTNTGLIEANGGEVYLTAKAARDVFTRVVNNSGVIRAGGVENQDGVIRLVGEGGDTFNSGSLIANSADGRGGVIDVLGERVALTGNALIDASGKTGGGQVRIGGDYQGSNPDITNASDTFVGSEVEIKADATDSGDGGRVIVWADNRTNYQGEISARGAGNNGNGGFAEVSGKQSLSFTGDADLGAENGSNGQLLLDPENLSIVADDGIAPGLPGIDETDFEFSGTTNSIDNDTITKLLLTTDLTLQAHDDITVAVGVSIDTGNSLTLEAGDDIHINATISNTGSGDLRFIAGSASAAPVNPDGDAQIVLGADVSSLGNQTYDGAIILSDDVALTATGMGSAVNLNGTMDGLQNLVVTGTLNSAGAVDINDLSVSSDATLSSTVNAGSIGIGGNAIISDLVTADSLAITGTTDLGTDVTTTGTQTYTGAVTLTNGATLSGTTVTANGVTGVHNLTVAGDADLNGAVSVNDLSVSGDAAFASTLDADAVTVGGNASIGDTATVDSLDITGTTDLAADVTTTGTQNYTGAVSLTNEVTLTGTTVIANAVTGVHNLTVAGDADLNGAVSVNDLSVSGDAAFASTLDADAVTVGGNAMVGGTITADSLNITGTTDLGADVTSTGDQTYGGNTTLSSDVVLTATGMGSAVNLGGTVDGAQRLELNADGINLSGDVGGTTALTEIVFDKAVALGVDITAGVQSFLNSL
ncbi:beta strand repeat-containing protein, partial [Amphritea japonica]|uniref:beta strand repeat-containing protein n=1 Tax=Amphritea japonica TaxID=452627 RepID=UPI00035CEE2E